MRQSWKIRFVGLALFLGTFFIIRAPLKGTFENSQYQDPWLRPEIMGQIYIGLNFEHAPPISEELSRWTRERYYAEEICKTMHTKEFWQRFLFRKILGFWYPLFNANNGAYYIFDYSFFFIVPFFLLGLWEAPKSSEYWLLVSIFMSVYAIVILFVYGYPRHRWPVDPVIIILGGYGLYHYIRSYFSRPILRFLFSVYGIISLIFLFFSNSLFSLASSLYFRMFLF